MAQKMEGRTQYLRCLPLLQLANDSDEYVFSTGIKIRGYCGNYRIGMTHLLKHYLWYESKNRCCGTKPQYVIR